MDNKLGDSKKLRIQLFHLLALAKVKLISLFTEKKKLAKLSKAYSQGLGTTTLLSMQKKV